ncbi:MAG: endonuclease V [Planctomycetota bacterium]|nr:endonuclease V [Planctomycetota bacterium]
MNTMPPPVRHDWDLTIEQAERLQEALSRQVIEADDGRPVRLVAGAVVTSGAHTSRIRAAVVVLEARSLTPIDKAVARGESTFPYRSGLRAFRELPTLLDAFDRLRTRPDLVVCAGHGRAHPRRLGLACHLGLWLDLPVIGCAMSRLIGTGPLPGAQRGARRRLVRDGEVVGEALRTRTNIRPVFVSIGHRVSLIAARRWVLRLAKDYRLPEPLRAATSARRRRESAP